MKNYTNLLLFAFFIITLLPACEVDKYGLEKRDTFFEKIDDEYWFFHKIKSIDSVYISKPVPGQQATQAFKDYADRMKTSCDSSRMVNYEIISLSELYEFIGENTTAENLVLRIGESTDPRNDNYNIYLFFTDVNGNPVTNSAGELQVRNDLIRCPPRCPGTIPEY